MKSEAGSAAECHSQAFLAFPARKDLALQDAAPTPTPFYTCHPIPLPSAPPGSVRIEDYFPFRAVIVLVILRPGTAQGQRP